MTAATDSPSHQMTFMGRSVLPCLEMSLAAWNAAQAAQLERSGVYPALARG